MTTTTIILDRNNCRDPMQLRRYARQSGWHSTDWRYIARKFAGTYGYICVWLADDRMVEFSLEDGKLHRRTIGPRNWKFA